MEMSLTYKNVQKYFNYPFSYGGNYVDIIYLPVAEVNV